jgi:hypothetical protein
VTVPFIQGWGVHWYAKVPGADNVTAFDSPGATLPVSNCPLVAVAVCGCWPALVQVTVSPAEIVTSGGVNAHVLMSEALASVISTVALSARADEAANDNASTRLATSELTTAANGTRRRPRIWIVACTRPSYPAGMRRRLDADVFIGSVNGCSIL